MLITVENAERKCELKSDVATLLPRALKQLFNELPLLNPKGEAAAPMKICTYIYM